ncbi:hypothetical protein WIW50_02670 [Flavobacteriaceae bacterium 3-367]|uniref:hypothetical protein n=1 Tax=Eudoraea algarum TaxID=3417568 RepID=UPI00326CE6BE
MENIPNWIILLFVATTLLTIFLFWLAAKKNKGVLYVLVIWLLIQAGIGLSGFYQNFDAVPPRFIFLLAPGFVVAALLFLTKGGKTFIQSLDLKWLTLLHTVRVPVELVLFYIFLGGLIPEDMTFEGKNFDIISGLTALLVYMVAFRGGVVKRKLLLFWNAISLGLLINILTIAVLSAKTPFQQMAFDQPNIGVMYFPLVWLPSVIVPLVLISQLAGISKLLAKGK